MLAGFLGAGEGPFSQVWREPWGFVAGMEFSQRLSLAAEGGGKQGEPWAGCEGAGTGKGLI